MTDTKSCRRICPGQHFANDSLFLLFASILSVYHISPAVDGAGNLIRVDADSSGEGILLYVMPINKLSTS